MERTGRLWFNRHNCWGMRRQNNLRAAGLFVLLVATLSLGTFISYRATTRIGDSEQWVSHTYDVMNSVDSLIVNLQRSQNAAADFVATGSPEYLQLYRDAASRSDQRIEKIQALTRDNAEQQIAVASIASKASSLKSALDDAVASRLQGKRVFLTGDQLRAVVQDLSAMKVRETELLKQRSEDAIINLRTTRVGLIAGAVINCILLLAGAFMIIRDQQQRSLIRESKLQMAAIVDFSEDAIIGKKLDGTITSWNSGAEHLYGYTAAEIIGHSIYDIVPPDRREELRMIMERLARGERIEHLETKRLRRDGSEVEMELTVSPIRNDHGAIVGASAIGRDIGKRKQLERSLHQLSGRILRAQDEERRRIAREIHDTTVQKLALLSMNLAQLKAARAGNGLVTSSQELTSECVQELRTLSYLLHPPMLDELGLGSALKIYVEGIAQRSGVMITTEVDAELPRLNAEAEMALFRVAQESLSNVLRHSGSKVAKIRLSSQDGVEMTIKDEGTGFVPKARDAELRIAVGVGIAGMNERISQLGGVLKVDSGPKGTTVTARVPTERAARA